MKSKRNKERFEYYNNIGIHINAPLEYPLSKKWDVISQREQQEKHMKELEEEKIRLKLEKRTNYSKIVKETHWPKISK